MTDRTDMINKCQDILAMEGVFHTDVLMVELMAIIEPHVKNEGYKEAAELAKEFGWHLPMHTDQSINEATDNAACDVRE